MQPSAPPEHDLRAMLAEALPQYRAHPGDYIELGRFGTSIAFGLTKRGAAVLAVDISEHVVQRLADELPQMVCADSTDVVALQQSGVAAATQAGWLSARKWWQACCTHWHLPKCESRRFGRRPARRMRFRPGDALAPDDTIIIAGPPNLVQHILQGGE